MAAHKLSHRVIDQDLLRQANHCVFAQYDRWSKGATFAKDG